MQYTNEDAERIRTFNGQYTTCHLIPVNQYQRGDCTRPCTSNAIIAHVCNDVGLWGRGFVKAISARWSQPEQEFRRWSREGTVTLGATQLVTVGPYLWVANMVAQRGVSGRIPLQYGALRSCLRSVAVCAQRLHAAVHMPRIGCGLGGGSWANVERLIHEMLIDEDVPVFIYDWSPTQSLR